MRETRRFLVLLLVITLMLFISVELASLRLAGANASVIELPPMSLTVVAVNGTQVVLNGTDIAGLSFYRGFGGYKNQLGMMKGLGNYTGVRISAICSLVGGLTNTSIVSVVAADDYSRAFSFAEVNGDFTTYNTVTGEEVAHSELIVPMIAYYFNDADVGPTDGPLRLAIAGPEGLATNSSYWVKQVIRIEITDATIAEFPTSLILPLPFIVASIAIFIGRTTKRRHRED